MTTTLHLNFLKIKPCSPASPFFPGQVRPWHQLRRNWKLHGTQGAEEVLKPSLNSVPTALCHNGQKNTVLLQINSACAHRQSIMARKRFA